MYLRLRPALFFVCRFFVFVVFLVILRLAGLGCDDEDGEVVFVFVECFHQRGDAGHDASRAVVGVEVDARLDFGAEGFFDFVLFLTQRAIARVGAVDVICFREFFEDAGVALVEHLHDVDQHADERVLHERAAAHAEAGEALVRHFVAVREVDRFEILEVDAIVLDRADGVALHRHRREALAARLDIRDCSVVLVPDVAVQDDGFRVLADNLFLFSKALVRQL